MKWLFAYGTLRPGGANYDLVAAHVQKAVPARVRGFLLHLPEGYPVALLGEGALPVHASIHGDGTIRGDLLALPDPAENPALWQRLDALEGTVGPGHPDNFYDRVPVEALPDGAAEPVAAEMYRLAPRYATPARQRGEAVTGGEWLEWLRQEVERLEQGPLPDILRPGLRAILVGFNPGLRSGEIHHHYAGRGNRFYELLYRSGLTAQRLTPEQDHRLLEFGLGSTNIVQRATAGAADLSRAEMLAGGRGLRLKIAYYRPRVVACLGKGVYQAMRDSLPRAAGWPGAPPAPRSQQPPVEYGLQPEPQVEGTIDFVAPNPSGRSGLPLAEKLRWYTALRDTIDTRERANG